MNLNVLNIFNKEWLKRKYPMTWLLMYPARENLIYRGAWLNYKTVIHQHHWYRSPCTTAGILKQIRLIPTFRYWSTRISHRNKWFVWFRTVDQSRDHELFESRLWSIFICSNWTKSWFSNSLKVDKRQNSTRSFVLKRNSGGPKFDFMTIFLHYSFLFWESDTLTQMRAPDTLASFKP